MRRVAVTSDRFDVVAPGYAGAGLEPVALPCIRIESATPAQLAEARRIVAGTDLLILTSPRVVSLMWPEGEMPGVDTVAVGPSTAKQVERAGGKVVLVGDAGLARLVELLTERIDGLKVTIAHAAGSDPVAMRRLRQAVPQLQEHVVYRAVPVPPGHDSVDAVAFASPSAVRGWALARTIDDVVVGAIGATTAAEIAHHREADVVADQPSHSSLARAIASFMEVKA